MTTRWPTMFAYGLGVAALFAVVAYSFRPTPLFVEGRPVTRGDLLVTIEEDGKTRIKEKYVVSSPLAGRLARVQLHPGDPVTGGETILTTLDPVAPTLLDARERAEAEARLKAAEASRKQVETTLEQSRVAAQFAQEEFERAQRLFEKKGLTHEDLDRAELKLRSANESLKGAVFAVQIADHELALAKAAMIHTHRDGTAGESDADSWRLEIRAPITGQVLRVFQESSAVVTMGAQLMEIGDTADLEVVVDILSSDAVKIAPSNEVLLDEWGGRESLHGRVRHVEPSGFTKISALGVEEQRVNVVIDLLDPLAKRQTLGDEFRVEARIVIDHARDVLKIPNGAVFRRGDESAVFVIEHGRAVIRPVTINRRNRLESEVTSGLSLDDHVIVFPGDKVHDGAAVQSLASRRE